MGTAGRKLILLRHAKSAWPDVPDRERPLARRGQRDAPVAGRWLWAAGHVPDQVLCSPARRARETWQLVRAGLGDVPPSVDFDDRVYQGSAAQLLDVVRGALSVTSALLLVGHDPAIQELALTLAASAPSGGDNAAPLALDHMRAKFPTAAIAVLGFTASWDQLGPGTASLICFVTPRDLRRKDSRQVAE